MALQTPIATGTNLAFENISGIEYPGTRIKHGAAGVALNVEDATPLPVKLVATNEYLGIVGGSSLIANISIQRPADTVAYAAGDLVSFNVNAAQINAAPTAINLARVAGGKGAILRVSVSTNKLGLSGTNVFRVHMLKGAPTVLSGDNGALSVNGISANHMGSVDVTLNRIFSDGAKGSVDLSSMLFETQTGQSSIYVLLESVSAYTPNSSEVFNVSLEVVRD